MASKTDSRSIEEVPDISSLPKLALAFDNMSPEELFVKLDELNNLPIVVKIGLMMLPRLSPKDFNRIKNRGFGLFVDAKLCDIPSQVAGAVRYWSELGADFLTIHLSGGRQMIAESIKEAGPDCRLLGVSLLTSMSGEDLVSVGMGSSVIDYVRSLCTVAFKEGLDSFVSSVGEVENIAEVAKSLGVENYFCCTPGLFWDQANFDQQRSVHWKVAVEKNSNLLVMGRAIVGSDQMRARCEEVLLSLAAKTN